MNMARVIGIVLIVVFVQVVQYLGNWLARRVLRR